jgi:hypothetical protein
VIVWLPEASPDVESDALPLASDALPIWTAPSKNRTVPVGVPAPGATAETLAVNVTVWRRLVGLRDEVSEVVVLA